MFAIVKTICFCFEYLQVWCKSVFIQNVIAPLIKGTFTDNLNILFNWWSFQIIVAVWQFIS